MEEKTVVSKPLRRAYKSHTRFHISLLLGLACLSWFLYQRITPEEPHRRFDEIAINRGPPEPKEEFAWAKIIPTKELEYTPCYEKFECARLDVPMDHKSLSEEGSRVAVAIIRYPTRVSVIHPQYAGPILLNPGGPGGSGVKFALSWAETISKIVNPALNGWGGPSEPDAKFYDIISFDPRGVNNTTPHVDCFPDNFSHDVFKLQIETEGFGSLEAKSNMWARAKALGACSETGSEILQHMNTAPVVADMVSIIERHGEWRSKQATSIVDNPNWVKSMVDFDDVDHPFARKSILERTQYRKGEEKLQYWGFSYGTVLGATFAALNPERVGRVIIDGVCDLADYYSTGWLTNLRDTDKIMENFYSYCSAANSSQCPLNTGSFTASEVRTVVENLITNIKEDTIPVPGNKERAADIITYSDVMNLIKDVFYTPLKLFPKQALLLADIAYGNGSLFADHKAKSHAPSCPPNPPNQPNQPNNKNTQPCVLPTTMAGPAIFCSDGKPLNHWNKKDWLSYIDTLVKQSKWMSEYWSSITLQCASWKGRAKWNVKAADLKGETAHPMLMIGNTLDPVTPLFNAFVMQKRFPGSEVLTQDSEGHCSIASASLCTVKAIRTYFQTGALPAPGTICLPEELPLLGKLDRDRSFLSEEDKLLLEVIDEMKDLESWTE